MGKYDRESLTNFCEISGVVLDVLPDNCNRDTRVSGPCLTGNCDSHFEKNLVQILDTSGPYCKECSTKRRMEKTAKTNLEKYGAKCSFQNEDVRNKYKENMMKKNGVENPSHIPSVIVKRKETTMTNHGVGCSFQSEEVKKKIRETNLERYNVENPAQNEDTKQKMKDTCLERYGVEYSLQNTDVRQKIKDTNVSNHGVENASQREDVKQKIKESFIENYGVSNPMKNEVIKEKLKKTNLERHGVEWGLQNPEILERNQKARFKRKLYITPSGKEWYLQGYEPLVAPKMIEEYGEENITPDIKIVPRIPWFDEDGKEHYYFCDFYVDSHKLIIEVKSDYTEKLNADKIQRTRKASNELGYDFRLIVLNKYGEWVEDTTTSNPYRQCSTSSPS